MKLHGIPEAGIRRIAQDLEEAEQVVLDWTVEEVSQYIALRWVDVGNPMLNYEKGNEVLSLVSGLSKEDMEKSPRQLPEEKAAISLIYEAIDLLQTEQLLPPPEPEMFRFAHSFGLRGGTSLGLAQSILSGGLRSQSEGVGAYSESPSSVFGVGTSHPADPEGRYNASAPWITMDIPLDGTVPYGGDAHVGGVVFMGDVPPEYIVGINGVTPAMFEEAFARWGPYEGAG